jgi:hypothetical protein
MARLLFRKIGKGLDASHIKLAMAEKEIKDLKH